MCQTETSFTYVFASCTSTLYGLTTLQHVQYHDRYWLRNVHVEDILNRLFSVRCKFHEIQTKEEATQSTTYIYPLQQFVEQLL